MEEEKNLFVKIFQKIFVNELTTNEKSSSATSKGNVWNIKGDKIEFDVERGLCGRISRDIGEKFDFSKGKNY